MWDQYANNRGHWYPRTFDDVTLYLAGYFGGSYLVLPLLKFFKRVYDVVILVFDFLLQSISICLKKRKTSG